MKRFFSYLWDSFLLIVLPNGVYCQLRDHCEICHGTRGGVRGNENRIEKKVMCDYCHVDYLQEPETDD